MTAALEQSLREGRPSDVGAVLGFALQVMGGHARETSGLVYVLRANNAEAIKVGHVSDQNRLLRRIREIQTGAAEPLTLVAAFGGGTNLERSFHRQMAVSRLSGEWFSDRGRHYTRQLQERMNEEGQRLVESWAAVCAARSSLQQAEERLKTDLLEFY